MLVILVILVEAMIHTFHGVLFSVMNSAKLPANKRNAAIK